MVSMCEGFEGPHFSRLPFRADKGFKHQRIDPKTATTHANLLKGKETEPVGTTVAPEMEAGELTRC